MSANKGTRPDLVVNLVLFTVVEDRELAFSRWGDGLVSPAIEEERPTGSLGLYVVTMRDPAADIADPNAPRVLPGAFVEGFETIEQTAQRIALEDLGIPAKLRLRQIGIFDQLDRNRTHQNRGERTISMPFWAAVSFDDLRRVLGGRNQVGLELVNSRTFMDDFTREMGHGLDEFDGVSRFGFRYRPTQVRGHERRLAKDLNKKPILADDHDEMVFYGWRKFRRAFTGNLDPLRFLGISPIGDMFRLSQYQELQDISTGTESQRDQFRRQMLSDDSFLSEMKIMKDTSRRGKPASLYSFNTVSDSVEGFNQELKRYEKAAASVEPAEETIDD